MDGARIRLVQFKWGSRSIQEHRVLSWSVSSQCPTLLSLAIFSNHFTPLPLLDSPLFQLCHLPTRLIISYILRSTSVPSPWLPYTIPTCCALCSHDLPFLNPSGLFTSIGSAPAYVSHCHMRLNNQSPSSHLIQLGLLLHVFPTHPPRT